MLDGQETVEISLGRASLGGSETACRERESMLDGQENVEIAYGELRWEGARQHAGRRGDRANSLRKASLGGSETACWTERKPRVEIAYGELRWEACWTERKPWK